MIRRTNLEFYSALSAASAVMLSLLVLASAAWKVFVTILPEAQFVERVGGARVDVQVLVGPGQEPHSYEPTPRQIAALDGARVYFRIGIPLEETLLAKVRATRTDLAVVDLREGIALLPMTEIDDTARA